MIDLHTHILPQFDDGAKTPQISLQMLRTESMQGVDTVVLTPHFYRFREALPDYLERREQAVQSFVHFLAQQPDRESLPRLLLGAEVAWVDNMADWDQLPQLCITGTRTLLLELPFRRWDNRVIDQIYELMEQRGVTPVIAHLERYVRQQPGELIQELLGMGLPVQINADPLLHLMGRRPSMQLLKSGVVSLVASDCHNLDTRRPCLKEGMAFIRQHFGAGAVQAMEENCRNLIEPVI